MSASVSLPVYTIPELVIQRTYVTYVRTKYTVNGDVKGKQIAGLGDRILTVLRDPESCRKLHKLAYAMKLKHAQLGPIEAPETLCQ